MTAPARVGQAEPLSGAARGTARGRPRRRPSGEPPALPRKINTSGMWWLGLALAVGGLWALTATTRVTGVTLDVVDHTVLEWIASL
ncbi:MAG: hypothetical protein QOE89_2080, partial [Pseudonocardiales bacterium]|nr:hypothetical protein [Pseudonocardiales bacterium]